MLFKVWMENEHFDLSAEELKLLKLLRNDTNLSEAVKEVLSLAEAEEWDANKVEGELITATRKLGRAAVGSWAASKAAHVEEEMEQCEPSLHRHKKKP